MSIIDMEMPISRMVLVSPWEKSRPPQRSTKAAQAMTPPVVTPSRSRVTAMIRAMNRTTASFSSSADCSAIPNRLIERRAPLMICPLKRT